MCGAIARFSVFSPAGPQGLCWPLALHYHPASTRGSAFLLSCPATEPALEAVSRATGAHGVFDTILRSRIKNMKLLEIISNMLDVYVGFNGYLFVWRF